MGNKEHYRKCAKCGSSPVQDQNLSFHRFPQPGKHRSLKARVWAKYCYPDEDWSTEKSLNDLYLQHKMLCSKHFDDSSYTNSSRTRLTNFAIPADAQNLLLELRELEEREKSCEILDDAPNHDIKEDQASKVFTEILRKLDINKAAELTPKKRKLYQRCTRNLHEIMRLTKILRKQPHALLQALVSSENVKQLMDKNISGSIALLLQSHLVKAPRKFTGRKWSIDDKVLALSIYKRSTTCYRLLNRLICLPSEYTLKALLNDVPIKCGINNKIFDTIKRTADDQISYENLCILAFDEMPIGKKLSYNNEQDIINGYQDHGTQGRSTELASRALLFMAIGIRKKWKQPLAYYFSGDSITADELSVLIKEVLEASFQAGLIIAATVCKNIAVNVKALNLLGSSVVNPFFYFKNHEIVTILDPPDLLKSFRDNFIKYDIDCTQQQNDGTQITGIAKWSHVKGFYDKDHANTGFVFAPALTKDHIEPNSQHKTKLTLACQVLSHSVAVGVLVKVANKELPQEATVTALIIENMDQLFDALNGDSPDSNRGKKLLTNMTNRSSHFEHFEKMKRMFRKLKFIGASTRPMCQDGFVRTINAVEHLFANLKKKYKINSLSTRRLNQEPLDNCFGCIRSYCGRNQNPNSTQFVAALKTAFIENLQHGSRNNSCRDDNNIVLSDLKSLYINDINQQSSIINVDKDQHDSSVHVDASEFGTPQCYGELQTCTYVCGYVIKKIRSNCKKCKTAMLVDQNIEVSHLFNFVEYNCINTSLMYINNNFIQTVASATTIVNKYLDEEGYVDELKNRLIYILKTQLTFDWLHTCSKHFDANRMHIIVSVIFLCVKSYCTIKNRIFEKEILKKSLS